MFQEFVWIAKMKHTCKLALQQCNNLYVQYEPITWWDYYIVLSNKVESEWMNQLLSVSHDDTYMCTDYVL